MTRLLSNEIQTRQRRARESERDMIMIVIMRLTHTTRHPTMATWPAKRSQEEPERAQQNENEKKNHTQCAAQSKSNDPRIFRCACPNAIKPF